MSSHSSTGSELCCDCDTIQHLMTKMIYHLLFYAYLTVITVAFAPSIQFRPGRRSDEPFIAVTLAKELMNPLGIQGDRFVVATENDALIGWAQTKPLGVEALRDPNEFDAMPGSYSLEEEVDNQMWDDFEQDDSIQVPTGWSSLPWTKEYRALQQSTKDRQEKRERRIQQQKEKEIQLLELSSVYVVPGFRGQGIGTELVKRVLQKELLQTNIPPSSIYCLTLASTAGWYCDNFGLEKVQDQDIPKPMMLEVAAGNVITKLVGAELCCMRGTSRTLEICQSIF